MTHRTYFLFVQTGVYRRDIRDPEHLSVDFDAAQSVLWQVFFFQTEEREVWEIAEYGLEPTVLCHDLAHARIFELVDVESEHRDVLRRARRGDRVENRLGKVFAEVNSGFLELQNFGNLLRKRQTSQARHLFRRETSLRLPVIKRRLKTRVPQTHAVFVVAPGSFGAVARRDVQAFFLGFFARFI